MQSRNGCQKKEYSKMQSDALPHTGGRSYCSCEAAPSCTAEQSSSKHTQSTGLLLQACMRPTAFQTWCTIFKSRVLRFLCCLLAKLTSASTGSCAFESSKHLDSMMRQSSRCCKQSLRLLMASCSSPIPVDQSNCASKQLTSDSAEMK